MIGPFNKTTKYVLIGAVSGVLIFWLWTTGAFFRLAYFDIRIKIFEFFFPTSFVLPGFFIAGVAGAVISLAILKISKIKSRLARGIDLMFIGAIAGALLGALFPMEGGFSEMIVLGGGAGAVAGSPVFLGINIVNELTKKKNKFIRGICLGFSIIIFTFIVFSRLYLLTQNLLQFGI